MQTNFSDTQLLDPATASSNQVLRTCVHCGFCTATCPTFVLLGDELDSPRGRIYLIKDMLESGRPATEEVVRHVDRCLSCLACMTTCPSGVNYMHLVDHAREYIENTYTRPWHERLMRNVLQAVLPRPGLFRLAMLGARAMKPLRGLVPGTSMPATRLRAMLDLAPASLPAASAMQAPQVHEAETARRGRVALLVGCAQTVLAALAGAQMYLDWGGGLVWIAGPASLHDRVAAAAQAGRGTWTVLRAPEPMRAAVHVVPAEAPALAAITRRVKAAMDPAGILNPGRLFAGV